MVVGLIAVHCHCNNPETGCEDCHRGTRMGWRFGPSGVPHQYFTAAQVKKFVEMFGEPKLFNYGDGSREAAIASIADRKMAEETKRAVAFG